MVVLTDVGVVPSVVVWSLFLSLPSAARSLLFSALVVLSSGAELKWYNLESRGRTRRATGRLQLGVRLLMNRSTSARAGAVGGVDKLKAIAEQRMDISR